MAFLSRVAKKEVVVQKVQNATFAQKRAAEEFSAGFSSGLTAKLEPLDPPNVMKVLVKYRPPQPCKWAGIEFWFLIELSEGYPNEAPRVWFIGGIAPGGRKCPRMYHPNIEGEIDKPIVLTPKDHAALASAPAGSVPGWQAGCCISVLRKDWRPTLGLNDIAYGIENLFWEPEKSDPLPGIAHDAANMMNTNEGQFWKKSLEWATGNY